MKKQSKWNRWWIAISITVVTLIVVIVYLYDTNRLELLWKFEWKSFSDFEQWVLGSAISGILLSWFSTFIYEHIFNKKNNKQSAENHQKTQDGIANIDKKLELLAKQQETTPEELRQKITELENKLDKESVKSMSPKLSAEIQQLFSELDFDGVRNRIDQVLAKYEDQTKDLAILHYQKSLAYEAEINYSKTKQELEIALALDNTNPEILHQYATILYTLSDYDQALEYFEKSLKIKLIIFEDENHPSIAISYNNIGLTWKSKGEYDKTIEYYAKSLEINLKIYENENHPNIAMNYNNIGMAWDSKGDYDKALEYFEKSLKIKLKIYEDEKHPNIATIYNNIGLAWYSKGEYDKAIEFYTKSLEINLKIYEDEKHPNIAMNYNNIGSAWESKGDYDKAIEYYTKSLEIFRKVHPNGHPYINITEKSLKLAKQKKIV